jgi:flagellar basal-body rod modification protein FlgD
MTSIDSIVAGSTVPVPPSSASSPTSAKQKLDGQMFMQLLVAQLRAQDPSSPMDTNAMMSQTTQLSSMEQLTSLTSLTQETFGLQMRIAAAGLVGKTVGFIGADGTPQTGVATAVSFAGSVPMVTVGSQSISLDAISGVVSAS